MRRALLGVCALAVWVGAPVDTSVAREDPPLDALLETLPEGFFGAADARTTRAMAALYYDRPILARELAEEILAEDPDSHMGHFLLGRVLHEAEGNFALALHHLERSLALLEEQYGTPEQEEPWFWHYRTLAELANVTGAMGRYQDSIDYIEKVDRLYTGGFQAELGWPLVFLGRHDEARRLAENLLATSEEPWVRTTAYRTLCVLEAELRRIEAAYEACLRALSARPIADMDPVNLTNAAEVARGLLRMDEAERLLLQATEHFRRGTLAAPWRDLLAMYLDQGRSGEALQAMREMFEWRDGQPPNIDMQAWTTQDMAAATLLLVAGRPVEAAHLTSRALDQPDRTGSNSVDDRQMKAAASLIDHVANFVASELRFEEAAASRLREAIPLWIEALRYRLRAWRSGRQAASLFAEQRLLESRIHPYAPGFANLPEWLELDLVGLLGPGVTRVALEAARGDLVDGGLGYAAAYEVEIAAARGRIVRSRVCRRTRCCCARASRREPPPRRRSRVRARAGSPSTISCSSSTPEPCVGSARPCPRDSRSPAGPWPTRRPSGCGAHRGFAKRSKASRSSSRATTPREAPAWSGCGDPFSPART